MSSDSARWVQGDIDWSQVVLPDFLHAHLVDDPGPYRPGAWIVLVHEGERIEIPIPLPEVDPNQVWGLVREAILALDADAIWEQAITSTGLNESPAGRMLQLVADALTEPG
jgi:hypothetical protein